MPIYLVAPFEHLGLYHTATKLLGVCVENRARLTIRRDSLRAASSRQAQQYCNMSCFV